MCCLKYEQYAYEDAARRMPKLESFVQTPDGPGNVKSIDLLRETVKVSLDSAPEGLKQYRNCEIRVLRNGKGSREGIEIGERTERYVEEKEDELLIPPIIATPYFVDAALEEAPVREKMSEESEGGRARRRGERRGRKGGRSGAEGRSGVVTEKKVEKKKEKPAEKAEKPLEKAEKSPDRRRGEHKAQEKKPEKKQKPAEKGEKKEKTEQRPARPPRAPRKERPAVSASAPEKQEGKGDEDKSRRRPHHRGGRRRSGNGGGEGSAPKAES